MDILVRFTDIFNSPCRWNCLRTHITFQHCGWCDSIPNGIGNASWDCLFIFSTPRYKQATFGQSRALLFALFQHQGNRKNDWYECIGANWLSERNEARSINFRTVLSHLNQTFSTHRAISMTWVVLCHSFLYTPGGSSQNTRWVSDVSSIFPLHDVVFCQKELQE